MSYEDEKTYTIDQRRNEVPQIECEDPVRSIVSQNGSIPVFRLDCWMNSQDKINNGIPREIEYQLAAGAVVVARPGFEQCQREQAALYYEAHSPGISEPMRAMQWITICANKKFWKWFIRA
jgi:hypothetical protein